MRIPNTKFVQRWTYCLIRSGAKSSNQTVVCFLENPSSHDLVSSALAGTNRREVALDRDDEALGLDVAALSADSQPQPFVYFKSGRVLTIAEDSLIPLRFPVSSESENDELEFSMVVDQQSARTGLLQHREDVCAVLEGIAPQSGQNSPLLLRVIQRSTSRWLELFAIVKSKEGHNTSHGIDVQRLMIYQLPQTVIPVSVRARYDLHTSSGTLYQHAQSHLVVVSLKNILPIITTQIGGELKPIDSFARVSSTILSVTVGFETMLVETTFGSTIAIITLPTEKSRHGTKRKRKRHQVAPLATENGLPTTITFSKVGIVAIVHTSRILALQLSQEVSSRRGATRLADVMSGGLLTNDLYKPDQSDTRSTTSKGYTNWCARVDELIKTGDTESLEHMVATDPLLGKQREIAQGAHHETSEDTPHPHLAAYVALWPLPETIDSHKIDHRRSTYLLGKLFAVSEASKRLLVALRAPKILQWLALAGLLDPASISNALWPNEKPQATLDAGDIMQAIYDIDSDFQIMNDLLSLPVQWEIGAVIQVLRFLIQSFSSAHAEDPGTALQLSLPSTLKDNFGSDASIIEPADAEQVDAVVHTAEMEVDRALETLHSGLEVRSETLRTVLERLNSFPADTIALNMRTLMTPTDIIFLIHLLRLEMASAGWTSRYVDREYDEREEACEATSHDTEVVDGVPQGALIDWIPGDGQKSPSDSGLLVIGELLNRAVDALGTTGWHVSLSGQVNETRQLLASLRSETSASLEACFEANALATFLGELHKPLDLADSGGDQEVSALLPLTGVDSRKTSVEKKKPYEVRRERSRHAGVYSFYRIQF